MQLDDYFFTAYNYEDGFLVLQMDNEILTINCPIEIDGFNGEYYEIIKENGEEYFKKNNLEFSVLDFPLE